MEIRVLGELEVLSDGLNRVGLPPSKKTRALLGYLAATGTPAPRARLCDLFWDGPEDPRAALRWSLTKLRASLRLASSGDSAALSTTLEHVALAPGVATVDLNAHRVALRAGVAAAETHTLEAALARFRGDFLEGLELPDCYRFQEWCIEERESLRRDRVALLAELIRRREDEPRLALAHARTWVSVDPAAELAHATVVRALGRLGRRREALEQYDRSRRQLGAELGVRPFPELESARMGVQMLSRDPRSSAPPEVLGLAEADAEGDGAPSVRAPFVGRERESSVVDGALDAIRARRGHPALYVSGEPGVGKTRLLEELAERARTHGVHPLVGRAFESETMRPYGPWLDALQAAPLSGVEPRLRAALAALLPSGGIAPKESVDRLGLFDSVVEILTALSGASPIVVVLDDVQWLDEASAALVHFVQRRKLPGVLLAFSARSGEIDDNAAARRLVRGLVRTGDASALELAPLGPEETARLVLAVEPRADARAVHAESEGNPLFSLEIGRARARGELSAELPKTLTGLLRERLERLPERALSLVTWAAALGRSFELSLLTEVSGLETPEVLAQVDELERRGVFRSAPAGSSQFGYDFSHDLLRRAAYDRLSVPRRRLHHAHVASVLERRLSTDDLSAHDLVRHAAESGDDALAQRASAVAARRCLRVFAYAEAVEVADRGRHHGSRLSLGAGLSGELELLGVLVHSAPLRRTTEIETALLDAIRLADAAANPDLVASGYYSLAVLRHSRGDILGAADSMERQAAAAGRGAAPEMLVRAVANAGRCYAMVGRELGRARALLDEAEQLAAAHGVVQVEIAFGRACLLHFDGELEGADVLFGSALDAIRTRSDHWQECECLVRMTMLALERGDDAAAAARADELLAVAARMDRSGSEGQTAEALSALSALARERPGAEEDVTRAIAKLRAIDTKGLLGYLLTTSARFALARGDVDTAENRAAEALSTAELLRSDDDLLVAQSLLAEVTRARGDEARADDWVARAERRARTAPAVSARARSAVEHARRTTKAGKGRG